MNFLFINPSVDSEVIYGRFRKLGGTLPPLGLAYIAAVLQKEGHSVQILDANVLRISGAKLVEFAGKYNPDVIGLTATTLTFSRARDIATLLKNSGFDVPMVIGGPHILGMEREVLDDECFDYGVFSEGEYTVRHFAEVIANGGNLREVNGLAFREGESSVVNPPRESIANLDELPFPARNLLPSLDCYKPKAISYKRLPATHIFTSRGCPFKCIFCRTAFGRIVRFHSPEYVIAEIEHLIMDHAIREVIINDDTFIVDKKRVYAICELILRRKIDISWSCNVRADLIDEPLLKMMKKAGCWAVAIGLESGSQKILSALKKGTTIEQGARACRWAYETGLHVRPSFILGNPLETPETIEKIIRFARSLPVHYPSFSLMTPFPGTEIWEDFEKFGTFDRNDLSKLSLSSKASFVPHGLTADFLEKKLKEAYRRVYIRPGMVVRHLRKVRGVEDLRKLLVAGLELLK